MKTCILPLLAWNRVYWRKQNALRTENWTAYAAAVRRFRDLDRRVGALARIGIVCMAGCLLGLLFVAILCAVEWFPAAWR